MSSPAIWSLRPDPDPLLVSALAQSLGIDLFMAAVLIRRGIHTFEEARAFFRPTLDDLHDPFLMKDMDRAIDRLTKALQAGERVLIYGDYDVDGTTSVTLVFSYLKRLGFDVDYYIPDRYKEGYGFSMGGVNYAHEGGFGLIVTLDCGIKDGERVTRCKERGIDVIICDHHLPGVLPEACAVLDAKRPDCPYPFKELSGCGVGFKLMQAYCIRHGLGMDDLLGYLDLLTVSIGADIVSMTGENRILAYYGLKQLNGERRPGIEALLRQSKFSRGQINISDVVFILAPRINAAGRIYSGRQAVELLLSATIEDALKLSPALEENNDTRKDLDKSITREALQSVEADDFYRNSFSLVVRGNDWHKGVIGIVASRLVEEYYRPTIVLTEIEGRLSGSARSIEGIDLYETLGACAHLLVQFGGHAMAAGVSLEASRFEEFRSRFDEEVAIRLGQIHPVRSLMIDSEIHLQELSDRNFRILQQMGPFGPDNMRPVFLARGVRNARFTKAVGDSKSHLKLHLRQDPSAAEYDGIAFGFGKLADSFEAGDAYDIVFSVEENEWKGEVRMQLNIKDIRPHQL